MKSLAVVFTMLALLAAGAVYDQMSAEDTEVICHVPPGNPAAAETKTVGPRAAEKHLAKHTQDTAGECESSFCEEDAIDTCIGSLDCFGVICTPDGVIDVECLSADECAVYEECLQANGVDTSGLDCSVPDICDTAPAPPVP